MSYIIYPVAWSNGNEKDLVSEDTFARDDKRYISQAAIDNSCS
jgi:hypothetical protein